MPVNTVSSLNILWSHFSCAFDQIFLELFGVFREEINQDFSCTEFKSIFLKYFPGKISER